MKIAIDLGHGIGKDRGAVGIIQEEKVINEVGALVIGKLKALGHQVIEVRPTEANSVNDSLYKRVNKSNENNVDLYVSIHANSTIGGYGTEVYTYNGVKFDKAVNVLTNITNLGFHDRGIKPSNDVAYVVNHTDAKAMLIETLFIDSQSDVDLYNKLGANRIADAIVKGLVGTTTQATGNSKPIENNKVNNISTHLRDWQGAYNDTYRKNILVDGIFGSQTEEALKNTIVKKGQNNSLVSWLQCRIGADTDGKFGTNTDSKLREFQKNNGLSVDGIAGYNTFKKLLEKFNW